MTTAELLAVVAVLLGAVAQAITGIGFSLICAPLLTLALGGGEGVLMANVLALVVNLIILARGRRQVVWRNAGLLLVSAAVAVPLTAWAIEGVDTDGLAVATGVLILAAVAALARGTRIRSLQGTAGAVVAGAASGAMNVTGGVGGPAVASYALNAGWDPATRRSTFAAYFFGLNVLSVAARGGPETSPGFFAALVAAVVVGYAVGIGPADRLDHDAVRRLTLALAAAGAVAVIVQAVV